MTRVIRVVLGGLLGGAALWLSLRDISSSMLRAALVSVEPIWAIAAVIATLLAVVAVVARWQLLLRPAHVGTPVLARATLVGQMLNILLPFRLGEVARVYGVSRHGGPGVARLTASLAIEKALDLSIFGVTAGTLVGNALLPRGLLSERRWLTLPLVTIAFLGVMALAVRLKIGARIAAWLQASGGAPGRWMARLVAEVANGLDAWRSAGHATGALTWTVVVFVLAAAGNQLLLLAFDMHLPLSAGFALLVVLQAGSVPPSLPGRLGIYNYLTVLTLGLYGVGRAEAATYSIALYITAYVPKLVLGALVAADPTWRPSKTWTANA